MSYPSAERTAAILRWAQHPEDLTLDGPTADEVEAFILHNLQSVCSYCGRIEQFADVEDRIARFTAAVRNHVVACPKNPVVQLYAAANVLGAAADQLAIDARHVNSIYESMIDETVIAGVESATRELHAVMFPAACPACGGDPASFCCEALQ